MCMRVKHKPDSNGHMWNSIEWRHNICTALSLYQLQQLQKFQPVSLLCAVLTRLQQRSPWRSARTLPTRFVLSECHTVSRYTINVISCTPTRKHAHCHETDTCTSLVPSITQICQQMCKILQEFIWAPKQSTTLAEHILDKRSAFFPHYVFLSLILFLQ
jgi:hypothetical protein